MLFKNQSCFYNWDRDRFNSPSRCLHSLFLQLSILGHVCILHKWTSSCSSSLVFRKLKQILFNTQLLLLRCLSLSFFISALTQHICVFFLVPSSFFNYTTSTELLLPRIWNKTSFKLLPQDISVFCDISHNFKPFCTIQFFISGYYHFSCLICTKFKKYLLATVFVVSFMSFFLILGLILVQLCSSSHSSRELNEFCKIWDKLFYFFSHSMVILN